MPSRTWSVWAATAVSDGERLEPVTIGTGGLASALDSPGLRSAVGLEVLAEHDVVGDDEPVDAGQVGRPGELEDVVPASRDPRPRTWAGRW